MPIKKHRRYLPGKGTLVASSVLLLLSAIAANAANITVTLSEATAAGPGKDVGHIGLEDSEHGLLIKPDLKGLKRGLHGFHVHENPNCGPVEWDGRLVPAGAAGGHYDPEKTGRHEGPYGDGHLGDLPNLIVEPDGTVSIPVLAPRLTVADMRGRALMIHAGADRYAGHAQHHHGKGGTRMYCNVIE